MVTFGCLYVPINEDNQTKSKANKNTKTTQKTTKDYYPDTGSTVQTRHRTNKTLEKTEKAIMNGQSRDTDYFGHTRHWTKTKKKKEKNTSHHHIYSVK
jgi:hypothetical protein